MSLEPFLDLTLVAIEDQILKREGDAATVEWTNVWLLAGIRKNKIWSMNAYFILIITLEISLQNSANLITFGLQNTRSQTSCPCP